MRPRPSLLKRLEWVGKVCLALAVSVMCWRPGRARRSRSLLETRGSKRVLVVRLDNRVGEALLTTPLIDALAKAGHEVHVLVHPKMRRVLAGHPRVTELHDYTPRFSCLRVLRARRFDVVVNCGNWDEAAVTSAVVSRLVGPSAVVMGPLHFPSGQLMDVAVIPKSGTRSEAQQRRHLGSPLVGSFETSAQLSFRSTPATALAEGRYAVVNPGGRLDFRRVSTERFAEAAQHLVDRGVTPVVTWGPGEEKLVDEVLARCPNAVRAPATSLDELASLMRGAVMTVCNNTGPMHLSVAVGCPTVALFLHMEIERWGHAYAPHQMVDLTGIDSPARVVAEALTSAASVTAPPNGSEAKP